ncbi:methyltransferase type 11 [Cubamyces lactineus]|nr:methyltransferase type 11 [Cubamyces lactineus]
MPAEVEYTHGHHESVLGLHSWRTVQNSAAYLLPHLKPNMTLLDIGCGPGTITTDFATILHEGHVTGLEMPSSNVFERARAHAASRGVTNVSFVAGDALALPFPDGTFDVVHAHQVIQYVGDPVRMLKEMRRVAKPGGIVAAREADMDGLVWYPEVEGLKEWQEGYIAVARASGGQPRAGRRLHAWAKEAGFADEDVALSASVWCFCTPEDRAYWSGLWADLTVSSHFAVSAKKHGICDEERLKRLAAAWRKWGAREDGWFTLMSGEMIARA